MKPLIIGFKMTTWPELSSAIENERNSNPSLGKNFKIGFPINPSELEDMKRNNHWVYSHFGKRVVPLHRDKILEKDIDYHNLDKYTVYTLFRAPSNTDNFLAKSADVAKKIWKNQIPISAVYLLNFYDIRDIFKLDFNYIEVGNMSSTWQNVSEYYTSKAKKDFIEDLKDIPNNRKGLIRSFLDKF